MFRSCRCACLLPVIAILLACCLVPLLIEQQVAGTATLTPTPSSIPSTTAAPKTATPSATPTPPPTATLPPATWTALPQPSATVTPISLLAMPVPEQVQQSILLDLWTTVKEEYLYPDFNGLNWDEIYTEYKARIEAGLSNDEFYAALDEMIMRLGDDHSIFLPPMEVAEENAEYEGNYDFVGIGVMLSAVPERQRAVILSTFAGSPAEASGLLPRDNVISVNNEPILDEEGFLRDIIRGPEGTLVTLTVQTPGKAPRHVTIERKRIQASLSVPYSVLESPGGKRIGYLLLTSFADTHIDDKIGEALAAMTSEGPLDGLILDNTQNSGGSDTVLRPSLGYFTQGVVGYFISREETRPLEIERGENINGSYDVPLVVLIGLDTASYGEVFAGVLKDIQRAYLIGETTEGNVETLWGYDFEDGSRAWIAHESFRPLNHPDQNWEESGIIPNQTILANWDEYTTETDPLVRAALAYFDRP